MRDRTEQLQHVMGNTDVREKMREVAMDMVPLIRKNMAFFQLMDVEVTMINVKQPFDESLLRAGAQHQVSYMLGWF